MTWNGVHMERSDNKSVVIESFWDNIGGHDSAVAKGLIPGQLIVNKFGGGTVTPDERTIWDGMIDADYPFKYTNTPMTIVSSNAADVGQKINISYIELVGTDWVYKKGTANTNGLASVTILESDDDFISIGTDAKIMFPYRIINTGTGQGIGSLVGELTIANGGVTYGKIINGFNQSLMAIFPIATGHSAIIHSVGRSVVGADKATTFTYSAIPFGECQQAKRVAGLISGSQFETFDLPYYFPEKTILIVRAAIEVGSALCNAWFDLVLFDNEFMM